MMVERNILLTLSLLSESSPTTTIEVLHQISAKEAALDIVVGAADVFNHNMETVPRLYPSIRPVLIITIPYQLS